MNETAPSVSIIVINYNTPELTAELIASIRQQTAGIRYDIIVVDNGSEPARRYQANATESVIRSIELPTNLGFGRAVNLAARECHSNYLLFANSDCELRENILPAMVAFLQQNPTCAACSPRLVFPDGTAHSSIRQFPNYSNILRSRGSILGSGGNYTLAADRTRKTVEAMAATFMMVRRADFEAIGGFDERFFMYVEDTDLCKRFHVEEKQVVYLGDLSVVHHWGASTRQHPWRMKWEHHRSISKYFRKHYQNRTAANFLLNILLAINYILVATKMFFVPSSR